jgi:hypothetical protein
MNAIKTIAFVSVALFCLTGGKCFFSSTFGDDDDDDEEEGLVIVVNNAETTTSEAVQATTQVLMVADLASQSAQYFQNLDTSYPLYYTCSNANGNLKATVVDLDHSNTITSGDELIFTYTNCSVGDVVANGDLKLSIVDANGTQIGHYNSGTDWYFSFSVNTDLFEFSTSSETYSASGSLEITLQFDATTAQLTATITGPKLAVATDLDNILSDINISQNISLATLPSSYVVSIESLKIFSGAQNAVMTVSTSSNPVSGMELLNINEYFVTLLAPENGVLSITGKNSKAEASIMPGKLVSIDVDDNNDSIFDSTVYSHWKNIQ